MHQGQLTTSQALAALESVLSRMDHSARASLAAEERLDLMQRARRVAGRMESLAAVLTDEANRAQASMKAAGTPLTSFLSGTENRDAKEAAAEVFKARDVATHDLVRGAALDGEVTSGQAAAIAKGMTQLPRSFDSGQLERAQQVFLDKARSATARELSKLAPLVAREVAPEEAPTPEQAAADLDAQRRRAVMKRSFKYGDDGDGSVWFHGSLPDVEAAPLIAKIQAYVEAERRDARDRRTGLRSLKPGPQVLRQTRHDDEERTPEQRRADALVRLVADHRDAPTVAGDRSRIVVTVDEADLRERAEAAGVLSSGARIGAGELRRLCCDAEVMPVVLGGASEILDVGRAQRLVTPAIRKALSVRDGGCVFPHCTAADAECQAHHVIPWAQDGDTSLGNLALCCPHHHAMVEPQRFNPSADQWQITFDPVTRKPQVHPPRRMRIYLRSRGGVPPEDVGAGPGQGSGGSGEGRRE